MDFDRETLKDRALRTVRLVGEDVLSSVKKKREALEDERESNGLHDFRVAMTR